MIWRLTIIVAAWLVLSAGAAAEESADTDDVRILVTFADPGMGRQARSGPMRLGYSRRISSYVTSIGVKRAARRIARDFGMRLVDDWPIVPLKIHCQVYAIASGEQVDEILTKLRSLPEVESAQRLNQFEVSSSADTGKTDPYSSLQHNLEVLEVAQAHTWSLGSGSNVTIIDTGADIHHPELENRIRNYQNYVDPKMGDFATDAHGTAVAGIIGAASNNGIGMTGVAPQAKLTVLKSCWYVDGKPTAICDSFTLAKALSSALESETQILNLSLAGPSDALLGRLVDLALSRGIIVVAAAPKNHRVGFPASIPGVIVVGQEDHEDYLVSAPGDDILVPVPGGGFDYASGSSLSAAQVSGIVALLVARQPQLSGGEILDLLVGSRTSINAPVNACRALALLLHESGCTNERVAQKSEPAELKILQTD